MPESVPVRRRRPLYLTVPDGMVSIARAAAAGWAGGAKKGHDTPMNDDMAKSLIAIRERSERLRGRL